MRPAHRLVAFLFLSLAVAAQRPPAKVPAPSEFLGFQVGADRQLADYKQIVSYLKAVDAASDRIELKNIGQTTLGADMMMAVISSEDNLRNQQRYREIARKLADPRGLSPAQIDALTKEGKLILLVTCNIHSNEIGASQMAMEWAHELAITQDAKKLRWLNDVILLLVPSLNPDGQTMVTEYYRKYVGTKYEGGPLPYLYHHYTGHDNNRDWYMLTQKETKNVSRVVYHEWFPQFWLDEHQMGMYGPRIYVPPNADPVAALVNPLVHRGNNLLGTNMAWRLEEAGKQGVIFGYQFDAYWPGGTRNTGWWKNMYGVLTEVASARIATPVEIAATDLRGEGKGLTEYKQQINFPNPWPGGTWRLRDILDYELIISNATLETASMYREDLLRGVAKMAMDAVRAGAPNEFWRIDRNRQHDPPAALRLAALMREHGVEVRISADGQSYLIPTAQPYGRFVEEMFGVQRYPEVKPAKDSGILEPYDVAAWTLPLLMGVMVEKVRLPEAAGAVATAAQLQGPSRKDLPPTVKPTHEVRIGLFKPYLASPSMDEGWTRFVLEQHGLAPKAIDQKTVRAGNLNASFDVIILPDLSKNQIVEGKSSTTGYSEELPPEYAGGIGKEGTQGLKSFVDNGGTLITLASSSELVLDEFNLPVRNALAGVKEADFNVPGSLLRVHVDNTHPVTLGMPKEIAAFVDAPLAFQTSVATSDVKRTVLAWYPDDSKDILLSGWIHGAERLERKAAAVAYARGKGKIVMFGFRVQHRAQTEGTFKLLFNAIHWAGMDAL